MAPSLRVAGLRVNQLAAASPRWTMRTRAENQHACPEAGNDEEIIPANSIHSRFRGSWSLLRERTDRSGRSIECPLSRARARCRQEGRRYHAFPVECPAQRIAKWLRSPGNDASLPIRRVEEARYASYWAVLHLPHEVAQYAASWPYRGAPHAVPSRAVLPRAKVMKRLLPVARNRAGSAGEALRSPGSRSGAGWPDHRVPFHEPAWLGLGEISFQDPEKDLPSGASWNVKVPRSVGSSHVPVSVCSLAVPVRRPPSWL